MSLSCSDPPVVSHYSWSKKQSSQHPFKFCTPPSISLISCPPIPCFSFPFLQLHFSLWSSNMPTILPALEPLHLLFPLLETPFLQISTGFAPSLPLCLCLNAFSSPSSTTTLAKSVSSTLSPYLGFFSP